MIKNKNGSVKRYPDTGIGFDAGMLIYLRILHFIRKEII